MSNYWNFKIKDRVEVKESGEYGFVVDVNEHYIFVSLDKDITRTHSFGEAPSSPIKAKDLINHTREPEVCTLWPVYGAA